jgi:uncharacterized protein with NAD-binding domain and iron-sulfur cluster
MKKKEKVVILGGGVAGMSAAHELAERGFDVAVYEARDIPGGKARSIPVSESGKNGKKELPGEHGFRFFPGFYQHITDTMKRIPYKNNCRGVFDNLVDATRISIPRFDKKGLTLPAKAPTTCTDVKILVNAFLQLISDQAGLEEGELEFFAQKLWQLITSCKERRIGEYEKVDWWTFVEADKFSPEYKSLLAKGLTESLVASKAKLASTKTVGDIFLQLLLDLINPTISTDRLLNGPTNEVWIAPWLAHLQTFGVDYHFNSLISSINYANGQIQSATIRDLKTNQQYEVEGDYYIAALPVEVMANLIIKSKLDRYDPTFKNIRALAKNVAWMNGIQFYLKEDVPIAYGHVLLVDTPWALTAISQKQFWRNVDLSEYGDGQVKGILSVDISDWGPFGDLPEENQESLGIKIKKYAKDCTDEQIKEEVWEQLKKSLNVNGQEILKDENLHTWFLDPDIVDPEKELFQWITLPEIEQVTLTEVAAHLHQDEQEAKMILQALIDLGYVKKIVKENGEIVYQSVFNIKSKINLEPLLVNLVNTWQLRPDAFTRIPNLFLASDYVRTNTDLATMEGANEAARRAVNAILEVSGSCACPCKIWELHEPEIFAPLRWHDSIRYQQGLPWKDIRLFRT